MAFKDYRNSCKSSKAREFNIERFAYDLFAYMLPICGFPEAKIPTTCLEENTYIEGDFVMNVGLSVLPIALYMRDEWKCLFEAKYEQNGFRHILDIKDFLESVHQNNELIDEEDTLSQVLFSLALYKEIILFFNFKSLEVYFDILTKLWSQLCQRLIAQSEDFSQDFESSFTMDIDITEAWITNFIKNYAIPYGSRTDVSEQFSLYSFECIFEDNDCPEEKSTDANLSSLPDAIAQASNVSDTKSEPPLIEDSESGLAILPGRQESLVFSEQLQEKNEEKAIVEMKPHGRHTSGLAYVLQQRFKGRKRSRSLKLEIEDAFKEISVEKENVSPENRDTKRRRQTSDEDKLE
ncbi:hypothetical protein HNY73_007127 [Argiope bruennichi]|uniref:Uncharacterized protein n=1 Tax=Argiope bruennichi TaxID=94029 RepID=A0A8T0FK08_ARGBR|nr:hypothetical protein HNY73_007127 [Argiope bruennichi]